MIPVNVITGFLGSGKTTLLGRLLATTAFADCAVLINELGEIGLDHQLLEHIDQETVLLQNGCLCCSVRSDLQQALVNLHDRRERSDVPQFTRVLIETTGLADPAPVLNTISADSVLRHHYRVGHVVTTVDAVNGLTHLAAHQEARRQVAIADRLVVTKADLVDPVQLEEIERALREFNPAALMAVSSNDVQASQLLLEEDLEAGAAEREVARWFVRQPAENPDYSLLARNRQNLHRSDVATLSLTIEPPLNWMEFGVWLTMLLHRHGSKILRVKGILNVVGSEQPVVIHGVQHLVHAPTHLSAWPGGVRMSRLVLIGSLPAKGLIESSLERFGCYSRPMADLTGMSPAGKIVSAL
jgi:G3E family GTPase